MADICRHNDSAVDLSSACGKAVAVTGFDVPSVVGEQSSELGVSCLGEDRAASGNLSFSSPKFMHDIIEHEYALVDSIPDEDRAALMPIIRFVRSTLQEPFIAPSSLSGGNAVDVSEGSGMLCRQVHGTQSCSVQSPQSQKNLHSISSMCPAFGLLYPPPRSVHTLCGNYASQPQEQHHGFSFRSHELQDPASPKFTAHESDLSSVLSGIDMESFHLEELRRSLGPYCDDKGSDVNDMDSVDVNNYGDDAYGEDDDGGDGDGSGGGDGIHDYGDEDDDDDDVDDMDEGLLAYHHHNKGPPASGMAWHSYWGNNLEYYPTPSTANLLQFPKLHCRRRHVIKKAVGWVKKGLTLSFASRVRHKRKCNLPCCTGCEAGRKRRKLSRNGSKKCVKLSVITEKLSHSTAMSMDMEEEKNNHRRPSKEEDWEGEVSASYESSDDKEESQVTQDWANSPLKAALIMLLTQSSSRGMTSYEAMQGLARRGYSKIIGSDSEALAGHVKTALKESPEFKELRNHRFILRDRRQLDSSTHQRMIHALRAQAATGEPKTELSMSQEGCCEDPAKTYLGASPSCTKLCQRQDQGKIPQCRKTDGKRWRCIRKAKPGFLYCERHQPSRSRPYARSSYTNKHISPCDDDGETNAAKDEEMSETVVDSCSGQSVEHDTDEAEPIRCCRTDGRTWQCSNRAEDGSLYCERHRSRCKKGTPKPHRHRPLPAISGNMRQLQKEAEVPQPIHPDPTVSKFSMQLRPRHNAVAALLISDFL